MSMGTHATVQCDVCETIFDSNETTTRLTAREQSTNAGWLVGDLDIDICPGCQRTRQMKMELSRDAASGYVIFKNPDGHYFGHPEDNTDELMFDRGTWEQMGHPRSLTITMTVVVEDGFVGDGAGDDRGWTVSARS